MLEINPMNKLLIYTLLVCFATTSGACRDDEPGGEVILCVEQDKNPFRPYELRIAKESVLAYEWSFTDAMQYEFSDRDQCDWNKLTGWSLKLIGNHKESLMVAWRWDTAGFWWIAPYYHLEGSTYYAITPCTPWTGTLHDEDLPFVAVYPGETFETHLNISNPDRRIVTVTIITDRDTVYFEKEFPDEAGFVREIYPWFGGTNPAPDYMCLTRRLIGRE